jgi:hypothetical protein
MRTMIGALALLTLAAGPVFAQTMIQAPQFGWAAQKLQETQLGFPLDLIIRRQPYSYY